MKQRVATILFADLVGSSEVASIKEPNSYNDYIKEFQETFQRIIYDVFKTDKVENKNSGGRILDFSIRGDEGFIIISTDKDSGQKNISLDISNILKFSWLLKIEWLFNKHYCISQLKNNKKPFEIAIGINTGSINLNEKTNKNTNQKYYSAEGYAINLAKRIEGESRKGTASGIFISEHTYGSYSKIPGEDILRFEQRGTSPLKGISGSVKLYELCFANLEDVAKNEEPEIVSIPSKYIDNDNWPKNVKTLSCIKDYFDGTLNTWLGNILCNFMWKRASDLLINYPGDKEKNNDAKNLLEQCIQLARKLIECDSDNGIWKIYLSQIIFDYISDIEGLDPDFIDLLILDTKDLLNNLASKNPEDLDARLYLGKYYLKTNRENQDRDKTINHFKRILLWKKEYYDAYYYLAASYLIPEKNSKISDKSKSQAIEFLQDYRYYANLSKEKSGDQAIKDTINDEIFDEIKDKIKTTFHDIFINKND